jgi:hypothetical protein
MVAWQLLAARLVPQSVPQACVQERCRRVSWKCWAQDGSPSIHRLGRVFINDNAQMSHQKNTHGTGQCQVPRQETPFDRPDCQQAVLHNIPPPLIQGDQAWTGE